MLNTEQRRVCEKVNIRSDT